MSEFNDPSYYVGEFRHTLDAKNRLTIPAKWRFAGDEQWKFMAFPQADGHIMVLPPAEGAKLWKKVFDQALSDTVAQKWQYKTFSQAETLTFDKNGRFTLPERLLQRFSISHDVVLVGMATKFAIWNPDDWAVMGPDNDKDNFSELMKQVGV